MQKSNNLSDLSGLAHLLASTEGMELIELTLLSNVAGAGPSYETKCSIRCRDAN